MNKLLITFCALLVLFTGCKSEIDKCANALMANDKDMDEGMARLTCLQVQNGHKESCSYEKTTSRSLCIPDGDIIPS